MSSSRIKGPHGLVTRDEGTRTYFLILPIAIVFCRHSILLVAAIDEKQNLWTIEDGIQAKDVLEGLLYVEAMFLAVRMLRGDS